MRAAWPTRWPMFPEVTVPTMYGHLTTAKVLTMGYVEGVKIIKVQEIEAAGWDHSTISRSMFLACDDQTDRLRRLFSRRCPSGKHPLQPADGHIIFLDMGMMGTLNQGQRMNLADLIWTLNGTDSYELAESLLRLSTPFKDVDVPQVPRRHRHGGGALSALPG